MSMVVCSVEISFNLIIAIEDLICESNPILFGLSLFVSSVKQKTQNSSDHEDRYQNTGCNFSS